MYPNTGQVNLCSCPLPPPHPLCQCSFMTCEERQDKKMNVVRYISTAEGGLGGPSSMIISPLTEDISTAESNLLSEQEPLISRHSQE